MRKFSNITGRLSEVHRFINVPMRWTEQYPARERRELWVTQSDGSEIKLVVHSRLLPARHGHMVSVLRWGDIVVGLTNLTTGHRVNFAKVDPPLLVCKRDVVHLLAILVLVTAGVTALSDPAWLIILVPAITSLLPALALVRWFGLSWLQTQVQACLKSSLRPVPWPSLRRVK